MVNISQSDDEHFKTIFQFLYEQNLEANIFDAYDVDKIFDLRILSVDPKFRGQRLATKLLDKSIEVAKENGFKLVKGDATSLFSQRSLISLDFVTIRELRYDMYEKNDELPLCNVAAPHETFKLMTKLI